MEKLVFQAQPLKTLSIKQKGERFPVHNVYCIGRNYAEHALEMGHDPLKEEPFFFQKHAENLDESGIFPYPLSKKKDINTRIDYEVELMVALKQSGSYNTVKEAEDAIFGFGIALDMTKRDLQKALKEQGKPWAISKAFAHSAPCSGLTPIEETGMLHQGKIALYVNEICQQEGDLGQMIWSIPEILIKLSHYFSLTSGDIVLTGTPKGVGPIHPGDTLRAQIEGLETLYVNVL